MQCKHAGVLCRAIANHLYKKNASTAFLHSSKLARFRFTFLLVFLQSGNQEEAMPVAPATFILTILKNDQDFTQMIQKIVSPS